MKEVTRPEHPIQDIDTSAKHPANVDQAGRETLAMAKKIADRYVAERKMVKIVRRGTGDTEYGEATEVLDDGTVKVKWQDMYGYKLTKNVPILEFLAWQGETIPETKPEKNIDKSYKDRALVNGIEMYVKWDPDVDYYIIYLPQIDETYAREHELKIPEQLIVIPKERNIAESLFTFAKESAAVVDDVYKLYKIIEKESNKRFNDIKNTQNT